MQREGRPAAGRTAEPVVTKRAPAKRAAKPVVSDRQADLEDMRTLLAAAMKTADEKDLPRVCRELRAVNAELASLTPAKSEGQQTVDELKARRVRRPAS